MARPAANSGKIPQRTCVGCRQVAAQPALVRVALLDGRVVVDRKRRAPGRGAYVHPRAECVRAAVRRGGLNRGFRRDVAAQVGLTELLEAVGAATSGG